MPYVRRRRRRSRRRLILGLKIAGALLVVVAAGAIWIALHAASAAHRLSAVRADIASLRADLIAGRSVTGDVAAIRTDSQSAYNDTHDPIWFLGSWLPPVGAVRGLTTVEAKLASQVLPPLVSAGQTLEPARLRVNGNRIALAPLHRAAPVLSNAAKAVQQVRQTAAGVSGGWFGQINDARQKIISQLDSVAGSITDAARFAQFGPAMLGEHGLRRYFVGIQNNAEARATGGLVAAWAIVTADHGRIRVAQHGNDSALRPAGAPTTTVSRDYQDLYGTFNPTQQWITSNLSPDFPAAANIWAHLWQAESGQHIDGVFGVDPYALQDLVAQTGPVAVPGYPQPLGGTNLASFVESKQYKVFQGPLLSFRKTFLGQVATAVIRKLLSGAGDPAALVSVMGHDAGTGHLRLWSAHPDEEAALAATPIAGAIPRTLAPYVALSIDNATGAKLDYYLQRSLDYHATTCTGSTRQATVTVRLRNGAPARGLPPYVLLRGDRGVLQPERVARSRLFVLLHLTHGASLDNATLDGRPVQLTSGVEQGHPVVRTELTINPGQTRVLQLDLTEPVPFGAPRTTVQPLQLPQRTALDVPSCG
ncbi:MAG TPA: DUF4012 domain-containing protein [Mycobacteriales bacterium]|nr:DUF4012 domain-containing protein [Mycobacteriales bacterium]